MISVQEARNRDDLKAFIHLPWRIYRGDRLWVPPLISEMWETLTSADNPLFRAGPHRVYLARRNGEPIGRLIAGYNAELNARKGQRTGYISLFEAVDDLDVAQALLGAAEAWLRREGMAQIKGPLSPTQGDDYRGILLDGFDEPPVLMDTYNPPYYPKLFDACGYRKEQDLLAFRYDKAHLPERVERVSEYAMKRYGFRVDPIRMGRLEADLQEITQIMEQAMPEDWSDLAPPSLADVAAEARRLKPLADPDLVLIARSADGQPIGFVVALPNYNEVLRYMNGRLFPLGWLQFLFRRRQIQGVRVFVLFVVPEWRKKAVTGALFTRLMHGALAKGYTWGEGSTIGETNTPMVREAEGAGGLRYKTYRLYVKSLGRDETP